MNKRKDQQFEGWLIDRKNQEVLTYFEEADLDYFSRNWFGLNSARKIELKRVKLLLLYNVEIRLMTDHFTNDLLVIQF